MLIGYMRASKSDGSQSLDLQREALLAAGIEANHIYENHASAKTTRGLGLFSACRFFTAHVD
jgi:DNA invertase Pin-like site-specific DNA recombinase